MTKLASHAAVRSGESAVTRLARIARQLVALTALAGAGALPAVLGASGCGGGSPKPATPPAEGTETSALPEPTPIVSASPAAADSASAAPAPDTSPLAQVLATDTGQIQKMFDAANAAPAATLKPSGAAGGDPLAKGIRDSSKKLAAGMQPDGPIAVGTIKEKGHLQTDVTLAPGKCYSIVGFSKKVKDLDLYLFLPPGILSGQDLTDDNAPIIGGAAQPMCPTSPTAVTYKLDIFADTGTGEVAVQLYSKGK